MTIYTRRLDILEFLDKTRPKDFREYKRKNPLHDELVAIFSLVPVIINSYQIYSAM